MKLRLHPAVPYPVHLELEPQARAVHNHLQREVEVVELDAAGRRQAGEQAPRNSIEVRRQRADVDQVARVGGRGLVRITRNQVVRYDERLAGAEVAGVVKRDG